MELLKIIQLNIYALVVLAVVIINEHRTHKQLFGNLIFRHLIRTVALLLVVDSLSWACNGRPGQIALVLNWFFNIELYLLAVIPCYLWLFYADFQIFRDKTRIRLLNRLALAILAVNTFLALMSIRFGWYFYIDAQNIYHRGPLFSVHVILCYAVFLVAFFLILANRKNINAKHYRSLLLFPLPPVLGSILQAMFYGLCLNWSSMVVSILIVYFNIQNLGLRTDYLTGVYNRRQLDSLLRERIKESTGKKTFSSILIDLDKFKQINDVFGHHAGDAALQDMAELLRSCLRNDDFIARFGGDEFYIILGVDKMDKLQEIADRIKKAGVAFNGKNDRPFRLDFSMGYDVYDHASGMRAEEFIRHLDSLMYTDKKNKG